jgi:hypothetical protein
MLAFLASLAASEVKYELKDNVFTITTTDKNDFIDDGKILEIFTENGKNFTKAIVTGPIQNISINTFNGATLCESYEIPDTIEYFESGAFEQNFALKSITLPKNLKSVGPYAFKDCQSLEKVVYYKTTIAFQVEAFSLCSSLKSFEKALNDETTPAEGKCYFGSKCFYNCPALQKVEFPDTLTAMWDDCFNGAAALVDVNLPAGLTVIPEGGFNGATKLETINLQNIKVIGKNGFSGCTSLKKLTTSAALKFINESAFQSDVKLEDVSSLDEAVNLTFGKYVFQACRSIKTFTLSEQMTEVPAYAFSGCSSLASITFKGPVSRFCKSAFYGTGFETFTIPNSISVIEESVFVAMRNLKSFDIDPNNDNYGVDSENNFLYNKVTKEIIIYPQGNAKETVVIPSKYEKIGFGAFAWCRKIIEVKFEGKIDTMGNQAFAHCTGLSGFITLPEGLVCVNDEAFYQCTGLNHVTIKNGTASLAKSAFERCYNLQAVVIPPSLQNFGEACFKSCRKLQSIDCQNANMIDKFCFSGCSALSSVKLSQKCKAISNGVFSYCTSLKTIKLSSELTHLYSFAFNGAGLESIEIPETCSRIDDHVFNGTALKTIKFPVAVDEVSMNVLSDTKSLVSVEFLGQVAQIGQEAFSGSSVKTIKFYNDIKNIAYSAFDDTKIESITYCGSSVITGEAFSSLSVKPKIFVTEDYDSKKFAAADITEVNRQKYCEGSTPLPPATEVPLNKLGKKNFIIIGCTIGGVILVVVLALVFIIPCVMRKRGWAKKETLTESLLTQTV